MSEPGPVDRGQATGESAWGWPMTADQSPRIIGHRVLRPRQQVEEGIKAAILSGELKSGEMLPPEAELARQFQVSRTTLREALRVLSTQHLITKVPGARGGNFVRSIDHDSLGTVVTEVFCGSLVGALLGWLCGLPPLGPTFQSVLVTTILGGLLGMFLAVCRCRSERELSIS